MTVTFLPAGSKTVSIASSDPKVTLPTATSQTVTGTTASFTISVANDYKPVLTAFIITGWLTVSDWKDQ